MAVQTMKRLRTIYYACLIYPYFTIGFSPHSLSLFRPASSMASMSSSSNNCPKTGNPLPNLPVPPYLLSLKPGSWAHDTMSRRLNKEIFERTLEENEAVFNSPEFFKALERFNKLRCELDNAAKTKLSFLKCDEIEDGRPSVIAERESRQWNEILAPYIENEDTWLSAPWLITEFYAYRRLIEAIGYFDMSNAATYLWDPFSVAKKVGLESSVSSAENMLGKIVSLPNTKEGVGLASAFALWGNKMDLSLWPADTLNSSLDVFEQILHRADNNLLHDDTPQLAEHCERLRARGGGKIDIIVDNAGFELVTDLAMADHLIASGVAQVVPFQLKSHPTFVSDALERDLLETVEHYSALPEATFPNARAAGMRWRQYLRDEKWICHEDNFWVQPSPMWEMPEPLRSELKERCDLAFVKGDANYRRLLGDRYWDYTSPFADVVGCYFPCALCALRTLKSEVGCGMNKEQVERASALDDAWMVNGRFGVVHFGLGAT